MQDSLLNLNKWRSTYCDIFSTFQQTRWIACELEYLVIFIDNSFLVRTGAHHREATERLPWNNCQARLVSGNTRQILFPWAKLTKRLILCDNISVKIAGAPPTPSWKKPWLKSAPQFLKVQWLSLETSFREWLLSMGNRCVGVLVVGVVMVVVVAVVVVVIVVVVEWGEGCRGEGCYQWLNY